MTPEDLSKLIAAGESQATEFKLSLAARDDGLRSLCAMVNTDAGTGVIVFGVAPDGTIQGIEPGNLDRAQQSLAQVIGSKFEPQLAAVIEIHRVGAHALLSLTATRLKSVAYHEFDGRAYIRVGTTVRQLTLVEKNALARSRDRHLHPGPWKCNGCNTWVGVLAGFNVTERGMERSFSCGCGGEFWPAT